MRHRAKPDSNAKEITAALRQAGWVVRTIKTPTDLAILWPATQWMAFAEIKRDAKAPYTKLQEAIRAEGWPFVTLASLDDVEQVTRMVRFDEPWRPR